jgi:hypothetical protein
MMAPKGYTKRQHVPQQMHKKLSGGSSSRRIVINSLVVQLCVHYACCYFVLGCEEQADTVESKSKVGPSMARFRLFLSRSHLT